MRLTVAVTGSGSLIGQGIIKSLKMSSLDARVVALDYFRHAVGLYWAEAGYLLPDVLAPHVAEEAYVARLAEILRRERAQVLLVATDFEVPILARHRGRLEAQTGCRVVVSSPEVAEIGHDKWATYTFLASQGLPCPPSLIELDRLDAFLDDVGLPVVVKPRRGSRSRGVTLVTDRAELSAALRAAGPEPIVQRAEGDEAAEYTCGTVVLDGDCLGAIVLRRDLRDGNTYRAYVEPAPELEALVQRVALALRPEGPANIQLRVGPRGPAIFEINVRFSGTTVMRALAGFNEVEAVVRWAAFRERVPLARRKTGVVLRYWEELFVDWNAYRGMEEPAIS